MGYVLRMPQMGMSMDRGTVVEWLVEEDEPVDPEDPVVVVESEKASNEVDSRETGVLRRILVAEGEAVEPGTPIGIIAGADEDLDSYESGLDLPSTDTESPDADEAGDAGAGATPAEDRPVGATADTDVQATPGARKRAEEAGIDLGGVEGSGPQGVITEDDVDAAATESAETSVKATPGARQRAEQEGIDLGRLDGTGPQGAITEADVEAHLEAAGDDATGGATRTVVEARPLTGMQATISERLSQSYREAVHVTLNRSFDTTTVRAVAAGAKELGVPGTLTDLFVKAIGETLTAHPAFNAVFEGDEHRLIEEVNVGIAVDVESGLVTPVIPEVTAKSTEAVNERRAALTERVQDGSFTMDDLAGGTFTVSNLGLFGVDDFNPIINPPQVAILGVGRIRDDDTMTLSLSFDHRIVNGADAARFLETLVDVLTDREALTGFYAADVSVDGDRPSNPREVRVENAEGYAGRYRTAFGDVRFDEPAEMGGSGSAPAPVDHLVGALGACLSLSVRAMAARDDLEVGAIEADLTGTPPDGDLEAVEVELTIDTPADEDAVDRVVTKAERACYVSRALADAVAVDVEWRPA